MFVTFEALCGDQPGLLFGDDAGVKGEVVGLDAVGEDHTVLRHLARDFQFLARPHVAPHYPRRRRLADERLDDTGRAVEDGAEPAGGPRTRRDDDAAG
jgi:hypothetical protein